MMRIGDRAYFDWLYAKIADPKDTNPQHSRFCLVSLLARTPFVPGCEDDENRRDAVEEIRYRAAEERGIVVHWREPTWLEVLLELAEQAEFWASGTDAEQTLAGWFWEFLDNVGLAVFSDEDWPEVERLAHKRLLDAIDGRSSFFIGSAEGSLWDQLGGYILNRTDLI